MKKIYLAGGCFWGVEHFFSLVKGISKLTVGYANSIIENPSYEEVCQNLTEAAETLEIIYDPEIITLDTLLDLFFRIIDPTSLNKQGHDEGKQYRTGIYFVDNEDEEVIKKALDNLSKHYEKKIVVECMPLKNFYKAEEYHQEYLIKNPNGYCHLDLNTFKIVKELGLNKD